MATDTNTEQLGPKTRAKADELGLSHEQALSLLEVAEGERPVQVERVKTRSRLRRWFLGLGIIGLGVGAAAVTKPYVEDFLTDVMAESTTRVTEREMEERVEAVQSKAQEFINMVNDALLPAMMNFMDVASKKLSDPERVMALAGRVYEGMKSDAWDYFESGWEDTTPDSLIAELESYISDDPDLNAAFQQLKRISTDISEWMKALPKDLSRQAEFTDEDRAEAMETLKTVTREQISQRWQAWNPFGQGTTSVPLPESPE